MTRTNVMASSRPQAQAAKRQGSSRVWRRLAILPIALALGLAPVAPALATTSTGPTTNYGNKAPEPTTTQKKEGGSGVSPTTSTKSPTTTPAKEAEPATESSTPTTTSTSSAKASTLPFTGFNLTWTVGGGLLLIAAGGSIMVMQRRERRDGGM